MAQIKTNKRAKSLLSLRTIEQMVLTLQNYKKASSDTLADIEEVVEPEDVIVLNGEGNYRLPLYGALKHLREIADICLRNISELENKLSNTVLTSDCKTLSDINRKLADSQAKIELLEKDIEETKIKLVETENENSKLRIELAEESDKVKLLESHLEKYNDNVGFLNRANEKINALQKDKADAGNLIEDLLISNSELKNKLYNFENKKRKYVPELRILGLIGAIEIIVLISLILFGTRSCSNSSDTVTGTTDSVHIYRDSLNNEVSYRQSLEASNAESVLKLKTKDSTILKLQSSISNMKGDVKKLKAVVLFNNATIYELKDSLRNKIVAIDSTADSAYPVYNRIVKDEWINADITLGLSKFDFKLKVKNEFDVKFTEEPDGFLNTKTIVTVVNKNPYTYTTDLISYNVKTQKTKVPFYTTASGIVLGAILGGLLF